MYLILILVSLFILVSNLFIGFINQPLPYQKEIYLLQFDKSFTILSSQKIIGMETIFINQPLQYQKEIHLL